ARPRSWATPLTASGCELESGQTSNQVDETAEDALPIGAQAIVLVLIGNPWPQAPNRDRCLLGEPALNVQIIYVNSRSDRDLILGKLLSVVKARQGVIRKDQGGGAMRAQRREILPHPPEDVLGGEVTFLGDLVGHRPLGRPARGHPVSVGRLVECGVNRVPPETHRLLHVVQEGPRAERQLDDVVDLLEAGAVAEFEAELEKAARSEPVAGREPDILITEPPEDVTDALAVSRVALEIGPVLRDGATPRRGVDVIDGPTDRRQAAGNKRLAQAGRGEREVGHG